MTYSLSKKSKAILDTVEPALSAVVARAIELTEQDFAVTFGVRTHQQQYELFAMGRTRAELDKANVPAGVKAQPQEKKVTWTLNSRHFPDPKTGLANAVDLTAYPLDWSDIEKYKKIKTAMFKAAEELNTPLRWGGDWNRNGVTEHGEDDFGHFELA